MLAAPMESLNQASYHSRLGRSIERVCNMALPTVAHYNDPTRFFVPASESVTNVLSRVRVCANARLHLGFLDLGGALGRRFGSIGLSIDSLSTSVTATSQVGSGVVIDSNNRGEDQTQKVMAHYRLSGGVRVSLEEATPAHSGLGSGTQLALAIGTAVTRVFGQKISPRELALLLRRGSRSGSGVNLFEQGGLVVDGGHGRLTEIPPVISRLDFPEQWGIILVLDSTMQGLSGRAESDVFRILDPMTQRDAANLCHTTLMGLLPAVAEHDFQNFCEHIESIQLVIGDYFSRFQSGFCTSPSVGRVLEYCSRELHLRGVGQSSWGPTGFVFVESVEETTAVMEAMRAKFAKDSTIYFLNCSARNIGATITEISADQNPVRTPR